MVVRVLGVVVLLLVSGAVEASARDKSCPKGRKLAAEYEVVDGATGEPIEGAVIMLRLGEPWPRGRANSEEWWLPDEEWTAAGVTDPAGVARLDQAVNDRIFKSCPLVKGTSYEVEVISPGYTSHREPGSVDGRGRRIGLEEKPRFVPGLAPEDRVNASTLAIRGEGPMFTLQVDDFPGYVCARAVLWLRIRPTDLPADAWLQWPVQPDGSVRVYGRTEAPWSFDLEVGEEYLVDLFSYGSATRARTVTWASTDDVVHVPADEVEFRYYSGQFPCIKDLPLNRMPRRILP